MAKRLVKLILFSFFLCALFLCGCWDAMDIEDRGIALRAPGKRKRVVLLVSKEGHCLHDLLGRVAENDYPMEVVAVVGNHDNLAYIADNHGVPFYHVPFPKDAVGKRKAFEEVGEIVNSYEPDAIVMARFMQILPPDFCEMWEGRVLNIHHLDDLRILHEEMFAGGVVLERDVQRHGLLVVGIHREVDRLVARLPGLFLQPFAERASGALPAGLWVDPHVAQLRLQILRR